MSWVAKYGLHSPVIRAGMHSPLSVGRKIFRLNAWVWNIINTGNTLDNNSSPLGAYTPSLYDISTSLLKLNGARYYSETLSVHF